MNENKYLLFYYAVSLPFAFRNIYVKPVIAGREVYSTSVKYSRGNRYWVGLVTNFTDGMLIKPFQMKFNRARKVHSTSTVPGISGLKNDIKKFSP